MILKKLVIINEVTYRRSFFWLQERISNPREEDNLEGVVRLIQENGCYSVDMENLNFDLCLLDKRTVKKITKFLGIHVK